MKGVEAKLMILLCKERRNQKHEERHLPIVEMYVS